jgi:hypothetical protein
MSSQPEPPNPLTQQHCDCLTDVCRQCMQTAAMIDRAEKAGHDMSQARAINQQQLDTAMKTKAAFFPNQP